MENNISINRKHVKIAFVVIVANLTSAILHATHPANILLGCIAMIFNAACLFIVICACFYVVYYKRKLIKEQRTQIHWHEKLIEAMAQEVIKNGIRVFPANPKNNKNETSPADN